MLSDGRMEQVRSRFRAWGASGLRAADVEGLLADRDELAAEVGRLRAEHEDAIDLVLEYSRMLRGASKEVTRLEFLLGLARRACEAIVGHYEGMQAERPVGSRPRLTDCVALAREALAATGRQWGGDDDATDG